MTKNVLHIAHDYKRHPFVYKAYKVGDTSILKSHMTASQPLNLSTSKPLNF